MTSIYFVRHALPDTTNRNDRVRPLTEEGLRDSELITELLKHRNINLLLSSPYKRSIDTIQHLADTLHMEIITEEDLRERDSGSGYGEDFGKYLRQMWEDFHYKMEDAESLSEVQYRNIGMINKVLMEFQDQNIVIATHGTALSSILNYYDPHFQYEDYVKVLNYLPYIVKMDFEGEAYLGKTEIMIIKKNFIKL